MQIEYVKGPKSWGLVEYPGKPGHFYTGYDGMWEGQLRYNSGVKQNPKASMQVGKNVVITGDFRINSMSRGRSAANFSGTFRDADEVSYEFGMSGMMQLITLLQDEVFGMRDGYISGRWTLAKQGQSFFLQPFYKGEQ